MSNSAPRRVVLLLLLLGAGVGGAALWVLSHASSLPQPGSVAYEQVTRAFYRGLASLEVGLLDDARREFTSATGIVADEPAAWANLGLTQLRLGELDAAAAPIERALTLAPDNPALVTMAGRMEIARGRLDQGVAHLRRAVELEPQGLRARFALADEVERAAGPGADVEALQLLDELARVAPDNPAIQVERARVAAKAGNRAALQDAMTRLQASASAWPERAVEQFRALQAAVQAGDLQRAQLTTTFLRNVLTSVPSFLESLAAVRTPTELIAEPLDRFIALEPASSTPAPPDTTLTFSAEQPDGGESAALRALLVLHDGGTPRAVALDAGGFRQTDAAAVQWALPEGVQAAGAVAFDANNDFRTDLLAIWRGGIRLFLQDEGGGFRESPEPSLSCDCVVAWAADVEMDGDLDIVTAPESGAITVLRNNGNGRWTPQAMFGGVDGARAFAWADLDRDADPDAAFLDARGMLYVFRNRQAGDFVSAGGDAPADLAAIAAADTNGDSVFELVALDRRGTLLRLTRDGETWQRVEVGRWDGLADAQPGEYRVAAVDLDNNGALDIVASGRGASRIWLADEQYQLSPSDASPAGEAFAAADFEADGRVDLLAIADGRALRYANRGTRPYHWKRVQPRAQASAGDQRINSFAIGGDVEVRSGLLVQKQLLTGGPVHIGLGEQSALDVVRIVWPNGVAQAEFGEAVDDVLVAEQRLKGSCPWVFAWDGRQVGFVSDFLWRSPLGLRINAQDTAGVTQTEDWIRIAGNQLAAIDGAYDVRITAELWETHFFDHVSLMVVDHPADTDVFVDERFSPASPPTLQVHGVRDRRPVPRAVDHRGTDVTGLVASADGRHLASFARGRYQGIAEEHFVEIALDDRAAAAGGVLLARGWIYPTDSSINVAIGQGGHVTPAGLSLEAEGADGAWRVVDPALGFPAGKNKTLVIDLGPVRGARRVRLRTNLEISWDSLELAARTDAPMPVTRLPALSAELRYRGFSATTSPRGETPETPDYHRLATTSQRWRDLTGYHTRFGEVRELIAGVDDRYVIMNAGDELRLRFAEQPAPASGWRRDFVLVGDGWEKDGDYNTEFSDTVLPLPSHDRPEYGRGVVSRALEDDPVYQRHAADWQRYHTRYVTPERFVGGLATGSR